MGRRGGLFRGRRYRLADGALALIWASALPMTPTPTMNLAGFLATPPSASYVADTESVGSPVGDFSAADYAGYLQGDSAATGAALAADGFVAGFGGGWSDQATGRSLVELIVAFSGERGARRWLDSAEALAKASDYYQHSLRVTRIGPYWGVHYANPTAPAYADAVSFVKGNDFMTVGFVSTADDLGDAASIQAMKQFDSAPADSIPPAQWPENVHLLAGGISALKLAAAGAAAVAIVGFAIAFALYIRVRRGATPTADGKLSWDGEAPPPDG